VSVQPLRWRIGFRTPSRVISIAVAVGLLAGGLEGTLVAGPASAAPVTGVTFTPSSMVAGANTAWTVSFTPATALTSSDTVFVTFANGFGIPASPTVNLGAGFTCTTSSTAGSTTGQTVAIDLTGLGCSAFGGSEELTISGITNPAAAGSYSKTSFSVSTSVDSAGSPTVDVKILGVEDVSFLGSSMLGGAIGTTWTVGFNAGAGSGGSHTVVVVFASGFIIPTTPTVALGPAFTGCTGPPVATTSGTSVTVTLSGGCALAAGAAAARTPGGITNPPAGPAAAW
jgi:hypothetical protein